MPSPSPSHFVFITDDNFTLPTIVAITSLAVNKKEESIYTVHVLTKNLSATNLQRFQETKQQLSSITIEIIDTSEIIEKYSTMQQNRHVPVAALLKFFIPEILPELSKALYIDGDTIIQHDLTSLYQTNLADNYAAVVKDTRPIYCPDHLKELGCDNPFYFNSGVLLLNLDLMRHDGITQALIAFKLNNETYFMDQDAFNVIMGHRVIFLSYRYNFLNYNIETYSRRQLSKVYDYEFKGSSKSIYQSCHIIHLGGHYKPWKFNIGYLSKLYQSYFERSIYKDTDVTLGTKSQKLDRFKYCLSVLSVSKVLTKIKKILAR